MPKRTAKRLRMAATDMPPGTTALAPEINPVSEIAQVAPRPEFDLTSVPEVSNIVRRREKQIFFPTNTIGDRELTFIIPKDHFWTDVKNIEMVMEFEPLSATNTVLADIPNMRGHGTVDVYHTWYEDQLIHAYWNKLRVELNGYNLPDVSENYNLKAWMHTFLTTSPETQEKLKDSTLWERDISGATAVPASFVDLTEDVQLGFTRGTVFQPVFVYGADGDRRRKWNYFPFRKEKYENLSWGTIKGTHTQRDTPKHWLFQQTKCLPPNNELKLTFTQADLVSYLLTANGVAQDVNMRLKKMTI